MLYLLVIDESCYCVYVCMMFESPINQSRTAISGVLGKTITPLHLQPPQYYMIVASTVLHDCPCHMIFFGFLTKSSSLTFLLLTGTLTSDLYDQQVSS